MSLWREVECLCPVCSAWSQTGAATTNENFESDVPHVLGGRVMLSCGHGVSPDRVDLRLGPENRPFKLTG